MASCSNEREARELAVLKGVFRQVQLHQDVVDFVLTMGTASVSDFYGLVKAECYETELVEVVLDNTAQKGNALQVSRIRAAWRAAKVLILKTEKARLSGTIDDLDEPLEEQLQGELYQAWDDFHHFQFDMFTAPSDALLGRLYREVQRCQASVIPIKKVQSLASAAVPTSTQERDLGGQVRLSIGANAPEVDSVYVYFMGLRVLGHAYALIGQHDVPSKAQPGAFVRFAPWQVNAHYADFCLRKVMTTSMSPAQQLPWFHTKDELTRTKMVELMRSGWPQGEALVKAIAETEIAWSIPPEAGQAARNNNNNSSQSGGEPNSKRPKHVNHDESGKAICKPHNDARGCSNGKKCPNGKEHKCDVVKKDGTPCLSKSHGRGGHPRNL